MIAEVIVEVIEKKKIKSKHNYVKVFKGKYKMKLIHRILYKIKKIYGRI